MEKYAKMLRSINPGLLQGRQEMRKEELTDFQQLIRVPEYVYSEKEREARFGPRQDPGVVKMLYGSDPPAWTRVVTADRISSIAVYHGDQRTMIGELWNPLENELSLQETISRVNWEIVSLVKNYLVILRTIPLGHRESIKLIVRGSRASYRGGQWDQQLLEFLSWRCNRCEIDLYDENEIPSEKSSIVGSMRATVRRIASRYEGAGEGYDVFVDDAYLGLAGTQALTPVSPYWSLKHPEGTYDNFLHSREGRQFSHQRPLVPAPCGCSLCTVIGSVVENALEFQKVQRHCVHLGARPCLYPISASWLAQKDTLTQLRAGNHPVVEIADKRRVYEVAVTNPVKIVGDKAVLSDTPTPLSCQLSGMYRDYGTYEGRGYWVGKTVHFLGVDALILAGEKYKTCRGVGSFVSDPSVVMFVSSLANMHSVYADEIWCKDFVPGYVITGREFKSYHEQVKKRVVANAVIHPIEKLSSPKLLVPTESWQRVNEDGTPPLGVCSCSVSRGSSNPCDDHLVIRASVAKTPPARKKIRCRGKYKYAQGYFFSGDTWYQLQGSTITLDRIYFDDSTIWEVG